MKIPPKYQGKQYDAYKNGFNDAWLNRGNHRDYYINLAEQGFKCFREIELKNVTAYDEGYVAGLEKAKTLKGGLK